MKANHFIDANNKAIMSKATSVNCINNEKATFIIRVIIIRDF